MEEFGVYECCESEIGDDSIVDTKWVYRGNSDGECTRARIVARQYRWLEARDDIFAPASMQSTGRLIDLIACQKSQPTATADVTRAFFHVDQDEHLLVIPPKSWRQWRERNGLPSTGCTDRGRQRLLGLTTLQYRWIALGLSEIQQHLISSIPVVEKFI